MPPGLEMTEATEFTTKQRRERRRNEGRSADVGLWPTSRDPSGRPKTNRRVDVGLLVFSRPDGSLTARSAVGGTSLLCTLGALCASVFFVMSSFPSLLRCELR